MRVLLVAPRTDLLYVDKEVQAVLRSGLAVTPLIGEVTSTDLINEIKNGDHDVLWFATHGNANGVLLSDGTLSASELVPLVRERFRLVFLNSCGSLQTAQMIQEEANTDVICTILEVPDRQAFQTGSLFASALNTVGDVGVAYMRSKPGGNRLYLILQAIAPTKAIVEPLLREIRELREQIGRNEKRQAKNLAVVIFVNDVLLLLLWALANGAR